MVSKSTSGNFSSTRAAVADTKAVAIDVPDIVSVLSFGAVDNISVPGADSATFAPKFEKSARSKMLSAVFLTAPTAITVGSFAGKNFMAF